MPPGFGSVTLVLCVVALAPVLVDLLPGKVRIPQVVVLLALGILIGPSALGWADPTAVDLLQSLGLGFLFLLAGYELDPALLRERAGHLAAWSWLTSLALGAALVSLLYAAGVVHSPVTVAIALTTTALGTLLPILRDNDMLGGAFGRYVFAAGAVGELGPILAMAIFLGSRRSGVAIAMLVVFAAIAYAIAVLPTKARDTRVGAIILAREHSTSQTTLRISIALLAVLLWSSAQLGFDDVLGAFVAGMVLRRWSPGHVESLERKLDAVGYGFFIPIFFVYSGMTLDVDSIVHHPVAPILLLLVLLAVRGLPAFWWYRRDLPRIEQTQVMLLSATSLPLLVALTASAVAAGTMTTAAQAAGIGAGVVSVLVFPLVAIALQHRKLAAPTTREPLASGPTI